MKRYYRGKFVSKLMKTIFIVIAGMVLTFFCGSYLTNAGTITVNPGASIRSAINNASAGDTIRVYNGTYSEQINVTKSLILEGQSKTETIIKGGFNVTADNVTIKNFKISEGYSWSYLPAGNGNYKAGILVKSSNNTFDNNYVSGITADRGTATTEANLTSKADNDGGVAAGIFLISANNNLIANNTITSNAGGKGADQPSLWGNVISAGGGGCSVGIYFDSSHTNTIQSNTLANLQGGNGGAANPYKGYENNGGNSGGDGGKAVGFFINNSTKNNVLNNTVSNLTAGNGGSAYAWEAGGTGGVATGVLLQSASTGNNLENNTFAGLSGGKGGINTWQPLPIGMFGTNGSATAIWIKDNDSLNNSLTTLIASAAYLIPDSQKLNTINSKPIIYVYGKTDVNISTLQITTAVAPITIGGDILTGYQKVVKGSDAGVSAGIVFVNTSNSVIQNTTVSGFKGLPGGAGGYLDNGGNGGVSAGLYLSASSSNNLNTNTVNNLTAGDGGAGGTHGSGGGGGICAGVYFINSSNSNLVQNNAISSLTGGTGGQAGNDGSGGTGGISAGVCLESSLNNILQNNTISSLSGGVRGELADPGAVIGVEGAPTGIWIKDNDGLQNIITPLAVDGFYKVPDPAKINTINGKPILYIYGETNVKIASFDLTAPVVPITVGGNIRTGEYYGWEPRGVGSSGETSMGIALINTTDSLVENNTISGFKAMPGGAGGYAGRYKIGGGSGGTVTGIYLLGAANSSLQNNTIANLTGGTGGSAVEDSHGGTGGNSVGIYTYFTTNTQNSGNNISGLVEGIRGNGDGYGSISTAGPDPNALPGSAYYVYEDSAPFPPENLSAVSGDKKVTLYWDPPLFNGTSPITNYKIYRNGRLLITVNGMITSYLNSGLTNGTAYEYYLTAVNISSESVKSAAVWRTPGVADTTAPTVINTDPINNTIKVPVYKTITITFSENIQRGDRYNDINLKDASNNIINTNDTISGNNLLIDPANDLSFDTLYTVTLPFGVVKDLSSNNLAGGINFSFTTVSGSTNTVPPTEPLSDAINIFPVPFIAGKHAKLTFSNLVIPSEIKIYSLDGRLILEKEVNDLSYSFIPNELVAGVYMYLVKSSKGITSGKIIIIK